MKFKFCGDNDCPDWILAQINVFSKLTSIKLKLILKEVINHIITEKLNFGNVCKLTSDAKLNVEGIKSILAALNYIISSSVRYNVDSETLSNELQQLGLPREHSLTLSKMFSENFEKLKTLVKEKSLKFHKLNGYSYEIVTNLDERNSYVKCPSLIFKFDGTDHSKPISTSFYMSPQQLVSLTNDLKEAVEKMK